MQHSTTNITKFINIQKKKITPTKLENRNLKTKPFPATQHPTTNVTKLINIKQKITPTELESRNLKTVPSPATMKVRY